MIVDLSKKSFGVVRTMSGDDNSIDGRESVASSGGERPVDRSLDSDGNVSEGGGEHVGEEGLGKLEVGERQLYEKLRHQEKDERFEIERELKRQTDVRMRDFRSSTEDLGQDLRVHKSDREKLEKLEREREDYKTLRENVLKGYTSPAINIYNHPAYLAAMASATAGYPRSQTPESTTSTTPPLGDGPSHHWTFEEQFKQLYEISDDPKRKEFLDDLFQFMQKRGSPVNRIPIMAKQTLDLYELFKLVVSKGGLVEVINKKLWREITKGLNLPSSITSAAFTLRTQYMKYLYPYECEKLHLSTPQELQAAIDGNRREGRRSGYGYDLSPGPTLIPTSHPHPHFNGLMNGKFNGTNAGAEEESLPPTPTHRSLSERFAERDALAMEAASRAMEEATRKMEEASRAAALAAEEPPRKRLMTEEDRIMAHPGMPSAHLKITSRNDGRTEIDNSLVISMEINGIMYQGVLFAHQATRRM
ncbi:AT-rich interactive domain-containing protein 3C-like isoform X2 [Mya arenaria]|uniref:AT-rich interactive domain-containing protein 3C-like isoform X2 n=1 Tax=Mya arenaria TaxID=6604 RepID=UPI0022E5BDE7|nr:AT-rich interactive domain-containing protein 3C-like isoform X2 [Mya arenaria]